MKLNKSIAGKFFLLLVLIYCNSLLIAQSNQTDSLKQVLFKSNSNKEKIKTLIELSWQFKMIAEFDSAIQYANAALTLAKELNNKPIEGDIYRRLGRYYQNKNELEKARSFFYKAIKVREETGEHSPSDDYWDDRTLGVINLEIGFTYYIADNYTESIKYALKALELYEKAGHKKGIANAYGRLAGIYGDYLDFEKSHQYARLSLNMLMELNDREGVALTSCGLGEIETEMGYYDEALKNISSCFAYYNETSDRSGIANANRCFAKLYLEKAKAETILPTADKLYGLAEEKSLMALAYYNETGDYVSQAYVMYFLGEIYRGLKQFSKARDFLENAKNMSVATKNKYTAKLSYFGLSQLDSTLGNYASALKNYKLFLLYRDSIVNNLNTAKMEGSKLQYEFDKKEDSLKQQHAFTQVKLEGEKKQKYFYWIGLLLLGLLSFFVFTNFRKQKKLNRLADESHIREKAELELHSLRAQLNPHFMFNSLNAIQELILLEENEKAQSYLARFAKLLRMLLENADRPFIPLQRELDFLQLYLSLENLRIPDLQHYITIDPAINTEATVIPNMILQPYIENAIWHGLSHKKEDRKLGIRIIKPNGYVQYEIEDNGVGRVRSAELKSRFRKEHKSKGMELLSRRFKLLAKEYGSNIETVYSDVLKGNEIAGTMVTIKVPMEFSTEIKNQGS